MSNLLLLSLGLLMVVVWAISFSMVLDYTAYESSIVRYGQAILIFPFVALLVWMLVSLAQKLVPLLSRWLEIDPETTFMFTLLSTGAILACLPLFVVISYFAHYLLGVIDYKLVSSR